ncbi:50S ribosomal protein L25 [Candidatus Roseilinea sp. NK_OTU-006]|jgi:large subunit ribosomal protein L25|uniref:50S ribosomal protein L25 n=1 Tax=Candidatus Roseilinea sp. NK_OTU-006 TaxID=2704250 RepID=UPI00145F2B39|nr:50S ribosomal protein L25 [Candidatus Roseilinea sp. NK_OTU-006]
MADKIELRAEIRAAVGSGVNALRRSGKVPAIVYGRNTPNIPIQLDAREVTNTLRKTGHNTLITLHIAGKDAPQMVLTREVQRDPIRRTIQHIDFYAVSMTEKITASIRVMLEGEPEDVKSGVGVLLQERDTLKIECLPSDLIEAVTIDVSKMKVDDVVRVKDVVVPPGITLLDDPEDEVVRVTRFVEAKEEAAAEPAEVEVIEKGKKEEAEGAEE